MFCNWLLFGCISQKLFVIGQQLQSWSFGLCYLPRPWLQQITRTDLCLNQTLAILALRGALKFFAVLNVLGEDFMVIWREHDELLTASLKSSKISNHSHPVPFIFVSYCLIVCFKIKQQKLNNNCQGPI